MAGSRPVIRMVGGAITAVQRYSVPELPKRDVAHRAACAHASAAASSSSSVLPATAMKTPTAPGDDQPRVERCAAAARSCEFDEGLRGVVVLVACNREAIGFCHALADAVHPLIPLRSPVEALHADGSNERILGHRDSVTRAAVSCQPCPGQPAQQYEHRELGKLPRAAPDGLILQPGGHEHRPWLSVNDRWGPMLRARRGHGR
jgi:hypothetical protein